MRVVLGLSVARTHTFTYCKQDIWLIGARGGWTRWMFIDWFNRIAAIQHFTHRTCNGIRNFMLSFQL